jgi:hypothetical protein
MQYLLGWLEEAGQQDSESEEPKMIFGCSFRIVLELSVVVAFASLKPPWIVLAATAREEAVVAKVRAIAAMVRQCYKNHWSFAVRFRLSYSGKARQSCCSCS